jgi:hypothetical protein
MKEFYAAINGEFSASIFFKAEVVIKFQFGVSS